MMYAEYAAIPAINWSRLKALRVSPLQYLYEESHPREEAANLRIGLAMHAFVLEPDTFEARFVCYRGRRAGKLWDAFEADHAAQTILNEAEWDRAMGAASALMTHPVSSPFLLSGLRESVITWTDADTGLACKGRIDLCGADLIDIKSTGQMAPRQFAACAARFGYHTQLAFYYDGLVASGVNVRPEPILPVVQSEPPHDVCVYSLPAHVIAAGRDEYKRLLAILKRCQDAASWPGMAPDSVVPLELPEWIFSGDDGLVLTSAGQPLEGL